MVPQRVKSLVTQALGPVRWALKFERQVELKDIGGELQRRALIESADYVEKHLIHLNSTETKYALLTVALDHVVHKDGLYLEFGVFSGRTINHVARLVRHPVYGFDSFEGLPERWRDLFDAGRFKVSALPRVRSNVTLVKGWFNETLPGFLEEHPGDVSLLHVDCDLYSSTVTILDCLKPRIKAGTVIVFDEYFNYAGWREGEYKAFQEFITAEGWGYEYIGYNRLNEQVAVRITARPA
jgi:hypothetical protein